MYSYENATNGFNYSMINFQMVWRLTTKLSIITKKQVKNTCVYQDYQLPGLQDWKKAATNELGTARSKLDWYFLNLCLFSRYEFSKKTPI